MSNQIISQNAHAGQSSPRWHNRIFNTQTLLWFSLVLALSGSLRHVAAMFAAIDGNTAFGWLQALAIDAGLFALAYGIKSRKVAKRTTKPLWFGVILFSAISIYGNLAYGLLATSGNLPGWILASRPYVLAASLPVLVLYLAELLSDDRQHAAQVAEKEAKKLEKLDLATGKTLDTTPILPLASVNAERQQDKESRKRQLASLYRQNPAASISEFASKLGTSRATIRNYGNELGLEFASSGNGNGKGV